MDTIQEICRTPKDTRKQKIESYSKKQLVTVVEYFIHKAYYDELALSYSDDIHVPEGDRLFDWKEFFPKKQ